MNIWIIILALILLVMCLIIGVLYSLSDYTTIPGSILIFILLLWLVIRKIVQVSIFPGSCFFWRRVIENNYLKELSSHISTKLKNLKEYLESIKSSDLQKQELHNRNYKNFIDTFINNYLTIDKKMSRYQKSFFMLICKLKTILEDIDIFVNGTDKFSLYIWLDERLDYGQIDEICINNHESNEKFDLAMRVLDEIEYRLQECFKPKCCLGRAFRWLFDDTIACIEYMRVDLKKRFTCEEINFVNGKFKING